MMVLAHAGHWLAGLAYAAPVLALVAWLGVAKVKERRRIDEDGAAADAPDESSDAPERHPLARRGA